jgi:signal transduction histidine kinase/ActR/RegA family two-component response regulator/HAMP domain-containing protein
LSLFSTVNLRSRLIFLVLLAVLPALGVTLYTGLERRSQELSKARDNALDLAQEVSRAHKDLFENTRQILFALSQLPQVYQQDPAACSIIFARLLKQSQGSTNIVASDLRGDTFASITPMSTPINFSDRSWFQRVLQTRDFVIGEYQIGRINGKAQVVLAYPLLDNSGEIQGVLHSALDLEWLSEFIAQKGLSRTTRCNIFDRNGTVLAHYPNPEGFVGKSMAEAPIVKMALSQNEGAAEATSTAGEPCVYGYTSLRQGFEAIHVAVGIPKDLAFADANRALIRNLSLLVLGTLLALAAAWLVGEMAIMRQVNGLLRATQEVAGGNLAARTESPDTSGELGRLAQTFDKMAESLQGREMERRQAEESLRQHFERIHLLNRVARAVMERHDLKSLFRVVMQHLEDQLPVDFGGVYQFDPQNESVTVLVRGNKSLRLSEELNTPEGTVLRSFADPTIRSCFAGNAIYFPEISQVRDVQIQNLVRVGLHSLAAMPLAVDRKVFGFLLVARAEVDGFSNEEREFLTTLSEHVSLAANQAQLHQRLREAYDELRASQQAALQEERLRALGQMASGIAHDINNALSPIVGYSDMLLQCETSLGEPAREHLKSIRTAGEDIASTVAGMREFYRKRDAQEPLMPVSLNRLVEQVVDLTRPRWKDIPQEHGSVLEMHTDLQEDIPAVTGSESEIRQALMNLIFNAVDAMPQGGAITLRTSISGAQVALEVIDTGSGMDDETRRRCLEPFFSTKGERGTGLGLAMVYGVMYRHDGSVVIVSEPGKGTTVQLRFPVREPSQNGREQGDDASPPSPTRILCVDDELQQLEVVKLMLEKDQHRVEVAAGGQAGLDAFRAARGRGEPFDLVITDLGMPYVDGREVAQAVKRESPETPVILLTGWGAQIHIEGEMPSGVDYVASKPSTMNQLRQALRFVTGSAACPAGPTQPTTA